MRDKNNVKKGRNIIYNLRKNIKDASVIYSNIFYV